MPKGAICTSEHRTDVAAATHGEMGAVVKVRSLSLWRMWASAVTTLARLTTFWDEKEELPQKDSHFVTDCSHENGLSLDCATCAALLDVQDPRWFAH